MSYIQKAREAVAKYQVGVQPDLGHLLAVLIGARAKPETCASLASYKLHELAEMTISELKEKGLSENREKAN